MAQMSHKARRSTRNYVPAMRFNHFNEAVIHERQEVEVRRRTSMRRDPPMKSTRSNREISVLVTPATKTINFLSGSRSEEAERLEHAANKAGGPYRETH